MIDNPDRPDRDRPGVHDLVTPFVFVPHGAPDPVEWKQAHPGWVSFPATFVPHKPTIPRWTVINGKRWPLSRKGQPWPSNRFGRPICPLNEFPPGSPAPGTQPEHTQHIENACRAVLAPGGIDAAWFLAEGARARAEREAKRAAEPPRPPPASTLDGFEPAREYLASMRRVDAHMREFADAARQRDVARVQPTLIAAAIEEPTREAYEVAASIGLPEVVVTARRPENVDTAGRVAAGFGSGAAEAFRDAAEDAWTLAKAVPRFATDGAFRQEMADGAARLAELGREMASYVRNDPLGAAQDAFDGGRSFYHRFQAAREQARQNGSLTEFDARFAGRVAAEGVMAFLPLGTIGKAGKGADLAVNAAKSFASGRAVPTHPDGLAYRSDLPNHLRGPDGFRAGKLHGTHNQQVATAEIQARGGTYSLTPTGTPGINELRYQAVDPRTGTPKPRTKTVYDPEVYRDQQMLDMALRAGARAFEANKRNPSERIFDIYEGGVKFRTYIAVDKAGVPVVGNVHPIK